MKHFLNNFRNVLMIYLGCYTRFCVCAFSYNTVIILSSMCVCFFIFCDKTCNKYTQFVPVSSICSQKKWHWTKVFSLLVVCLLSESLQHWQQITFVKAPNHVGIHATIHRNKFAKNPISVPKKRYFDRFFFVFPIISRSFKYDALIL